MLPYGLKVPNPSPFAHFPSTITHAAFELHRAQAQMYDYNARLRLGLHYAAAAPGHPLSPYPSGPHDPLAYIYGKQDPRTRFLHEEPKPSHSYIGLIAMAILSSKEKKLVLSDIYQWILDNYPYFRTRGPGWRNSIRHNLSLNDCFIKAGRSANGKGHYWAIHPANTEDFQKGDFRRRRAQRKVRKAMGLAVPDEEDSPSPPPTSATLEWQQRVMMNESNVSTEGEGEGGEKTDDSPSSTNPGNMPRYLPAPNSNNGKKRLFDVESLLAPDHRQHPLAKKLCIEVSPRHDHREESKEGHSSHDLEKSDDEEDGIIEVDTIGDEDEDRAEDLRKVSGEGSLGGGASRSETPRSTHSDLRAASTSPLGGGGSGEPPVLKREAPGMGPERHAMLSTWQERPSAFHSTLPATVSAWSSLHPHGGYPLLTAPYPLHPGAAMPNIDSAQKWQEAFSRIMARTSDKNLKLETWVCYSHHKAGGHCVQLLRYIFANNGLVALQYNSCC